jgi:hypothetical protein
MTNGKLAFFKTKNSFIKTIHSMESFFEKKSYVKCDSEQYVKELTLKNKSYLYSEKKIIFFLSNLLKQLKKIVFKKPENKNIIIFDCVSSFELEKILSTEETLVLSTRVNRIKKIYLNFQIIFNIIKYKRKLTLRLAYLAAIIKQINPKIVFTFVHHSDDFKIISGIFRNKIKFIPIQNADTSHQPFEKYEFKKLELYKNSYFSELLCFSQYDEEIFKKSKINLNIKKYLHVGSLRAWLGKKYAEEKKLITNDKNQYDICLIGKDIFYINDQEDKNYFNEKLYTNRCLESYYILNLHLSKFCKKYNLKICVALKGKKKINAPAKLNAEANNYFYENIYKGNNIELVHGDIHNFSSYVTIMNSKFIISVQDTMLRESIIFKKKILCCSYYPDIEMHEALSGKQLLTDNSYEAFEERVLEILNMSTEEFYKQIKPSPNYRMAPANTINSIQDMVNSK